MISTFSVLLSAKNEQQQSGSLLHGLKMPALQSRNTYQFIWIIPLIFHFGLLCLCCYFHIYRVEVLQNMYNLGIVNETFGGSARFLTIWGQYLTLIYCFISCINDIAYLFNSNMKHSIRSLIHHSFYPLCTVTTIIALFFWSIFWIDKDLMIPKKFRPHFPMDLNVFQHGGNAFILWIDAIFCGKRVYRKTLHLLHSLYFGLIYQLWSIICTSINGFHAYPFLNHFTLKQHIIFFGGVVTVAATIQFIIMYIIEKVHHRADDTAKKSQ